MILQCRMKNIWQTAVSAALLLLVMSGCAVAQTPPIVRVALLAPFEGRYREVGYDALYAARLALSDSDTTQVVLLAVDDGGTPENAAARAQALALDPSVRAVLLVGYAATDPATLDALGDVPAIVIGAWGVSPRGGLQVMASPSAEVLPRLDVLDAARQDAPLVCGEVCALKQFARLRDDLEGVEIRTSAALPDADFVARYLASGQFVDDPGLLVTLAYDAAGFLATLTADAPSRETVLERLKTLEHNGINGRIRFELGFWTDAPDFVYQYRGGVLTRVSDS